MFTHPGVGRAEPNVSFRLRLDFLTLNTSPSDDSSPPRVAAQQISTKRNREECAITWSSVPKLSLDLGLDRFCLFLSFAANVSGVVEGESTSITSLAGGDASRILEARERTRLII